MSNEAQIRVSLQVNVGNQVYRNTPVAFNADVSSGDGPFPGLVLVTTDGVDVDLSSLSAPSLAWIYNLSETYVVHMGIYDPTRALFFPLLEFRPGEGFPVRLSRDLGEQWYGTVGTSTETPANTLRLRSVGGAASVKFEALND